MQSEVRPVHDGELDDALTILANAYPALELHHEEQRRLREDRLLAMSQRPDQTLYGLYRDDRLLGVMILYDFQMQLHSTLVPAGGVGQIAVDLVHKKEKVAKELMLYFLSHYRRRGFPLLMLYPFRPDFYKKMGFGFGTKINHYRFAPAALPRGPSCAHLRFLSAADSEAMLACYNDFLQSTNGMIIRSQDHFVRLLSNPSVRAVGHWEGDRLLGYLAFTFARGDHFLKNDLRVIELIFLDSSSLSELLTLLHTQLDQIERVLISTQDDSFHHLMSDPRNDSGRLIPPVYHETNTQGVGLMYRAINTAGIFEALSEHNFGGQTCRLRLDLTDSFFPINAGATVVAFQNGRPQLVEDGRQEVTISMGVAEFSSMLLGVVSFRRLYGYNLANISDSSYLEVVNRLFYCEEKPVCMTHF